MDHEEALNPASKPKRSAMFVFCLLEGAGGNDFCGSLPRDRAEKTADWLSDNDVAY